MTNHGLSFLERIPDAISVDFPSDVIRQTQRLVETGINDQSPSRREVQGITIDGINSLDLDDGIWAERTRDGYRVYIHISDVTEAIPMHSPIDTEAILRTTSIYRRDQVIPMIPEALSNGLLSLGSGEKNLTLTVQVDLDVFGTIKSSKIYESCFTNQRRYDYESFQNDSNNPDHPNYKVISLLSEIAQKLHHNRKQAGGALYLDVEDQADGTRRKQSSHKIIESFMVLANHTIGRYLEEQDLLGIFRHHNAIDERAFYAPKNGFHTGLAMSNYAHFTSPIRRLSD